METSITCPVKNLVDSDKRSLENLLGGQLQESQQVFLVAYTPGIEPTAGVRAEAAARVEQTLAKSAAHASRIGATDETIDDAVDAAMNDVRRRSAS